MAELVGRSGLHKVEGVCDLCGKECDTNVEHCNALDCTFQGCPPLVYHQECLEKFLKSVKLDKNRKTGFRCPRGCGKGTSFSAPCPGKIDKSHPIVSRGDDSKKRKKQQAQPPSPHNAPDAQAAAKRTEERPKSRSAASPAGTPPAPSAISIQIKNVAAQKLLNIPAPKPKPEAPKPPSERDQLANALAAARRELGLGNDAGGSGSGSGAGSGRVSGSLPRATSEEIHSPVPNAWSRGTSSLIPQGTPPPPPPPPRASSGRAAMPPPPPPRAGGDSGKRSGAGDDAWPKPVAAAPAPLQGVWGARAKGSNGPGDSTSQGGSPPRGNSMSVLGFSGRQNSGTAGHGDSDGTAARLGRLWVGSEDGDGSGSEGGSSRPGRAHARGFESVGKRQSSVAASGTGTPTVPGNDAGSEAGHSQEPGHGTPEVRLTKAQKKNLKRAEKKANKRAAELAARASTAGEPSEGGDDDGGASDDGGSQPGGRARSQAGMTHAEAMAAAVAASEDAPDQPPAPPPAAAQQPPPAQTQTQAPAPAPAPQQQPADVFNEAVACLVAAKMQQHVADLTLLSFPAWRASVAVQKFGSDVRSALAWLLEGNATTEAEARAIAEGLAASDSAPEVTFDIDGELAMLHAVESAVPAGGPSPWSAVVASQGNVRRTLDMLVRAGALMTEQAVACAARLAVQMYGGPPAAQAARRPAEQQREQAPPASLGLQSPVAAQEQPPGMLHLQQQQPALSAEHQQQQAPQQGGSGMFPSFQWPPSSSAATSQPLSGAGLQSLLTAMGGGQARSPGLSTSGPGSAFQDPAIAGMGQRLPLSSPDPPHGARPPGMGARPPPPGLGGGSGTTEQRASLLRALGLGGASAGEQAGAGLTPGGAAPMNGGLSQGFGTSAYDPFLFARPAGAK